MSSKSHSSRCSRTCSKSCKGQIEREIECRWGKLFVLHGKIATQFRARWKQHNEDKKKEKEEGAKYRQSVSLDKPERARAQAPVQRSLTIDPATLNPKDRGQSIPGPDDFTGTDRVHLTPEKPIQMYRSVSTSDEKKGTADDTKDDGPGSAWRRTGRNFQFANRIGRTIRRARMWRSRSRMNSTTSSQKVRFPKRPYDSHVKEMDLPDRARKIETYLEKIFNCEQKKTFRSLEEFKELFGLSKYTFIRELGLMGFEGALDKQSGGTGLDKSCSRLLRCQWGGIIKIWHSRWIILRESFIAICRDNKEIRQVLLFDRDTKFDFTEDSRVKIINNSR